MQICCVLPFLVLASGSLAQTGTTGTGALVAESASSAAALRIDSDRSHAEFWIRPLWIKRIDGRFPVIEGEVKFDPDGMTHVEVEIDARAVQMDTLAQVRFAQSEKFFDVERHPVIRFRSRPVPRERLFEAGPVFGTVTLRGVTAPVQLEAQLMTCADPGFDCPLKASGEISRSRFGMDSHQLAMGDQVHLDFTLWLRRDPEPEAAP